jgi:hypothetical protein
MQTNNSCLNISEKRLTNTNRLAKCPKCGKRIKKDVNLLSLDLLFGNVSLKKDKKAKCDLCGSKLKKRK